jgi:N-(2-amino-2-carboxyethyl)-L-glutamate synthase
VSETVSVEELVGVDPCGTLRGLTTLSPMALRVALDSIGATPMVQIVLGGGLRSREIFLKLEAFNLTGSIKDRTALGLMNDLRQRGALRPGVTLVESTSGNLGVALALLARANSVGFIAVVDPKASRENLSKILALGGAVEMVDEKDEQGGHLGARLLRVQELVEEVPGAIWTNQYGERSNPRAHETGTGPEILRQMHQEVDAIFVAASTCGTLAGIGTYFRQVNSQTRIIAVDEVGSVVFGGSPGPRSLVGVGSSRRPDFDIDGLYDDVVHVDAGTAFATCRALDRHCGLRIGGSSGAVLAACGQYLQRGAHDLRRVVCLCPDGGAGYESTIWNDRWLIDRGFNPSSYDSPIQVETGAEIWPNRAMWCSNAYLNHGA